MAGKPQQPAVKRKVQDAAKIQRSAIEQRRKELAAFAREPSIKMPLSGYARGAVAAW